MNYHGYTKINATEIYVIFSCDLCPPVSYYEAGRDEKWTFTKKYTIYSRKYAYTVTQETNLAAVICRS